MLRDRPQDWQAGINELCNGSLRLRWHAGWFGPWGPSATCWGPLTPVRVPVQRIEVWFDTHEIWLPFLARLYVRRALRRRLLEAML
ncbi:MAG: hypothetical protein ACE5K7_06710 [Phycisphaerae bacterium]